MSFWKISIILTIVGGAYSGFQYYRNVEQTRTDIQELKAAIAQVQEGNQQNQAAWSHLEAVHGKAAQVMTRKAGLLKQKEDLQGKIKRLEDECTALVKTTRDVVDKARTDAAGQTYPEIKLEDGRVLRDAKIRKFEGTQVSFIHADGVVTVAAELLPAALRQRFSIGTNDLAVEAATLATSTFSTGGAQDIDGLTIRSPYTLLAGNLPPGLSQGAAIQSARTFNHKASDIEVDVTTIQYTAGFALNLDEAVAGSVKGVSALGGVTNPVHQVQHLTISGSPACRLSFTARRSGETLCLESVYVARGQHLWIVQTVFSDKSKDARPIANSILSSITLSPPKS